LTTARRARRRNRLKRAIFLFFVAVFLFSVSPAALGQTKGPSEYDVKAAFLFRFAQFVEWPESAFREVNSPLIYCTVGGDPFQGVLDATFRGKAVGAHALEVRHLKETDDVRGCHVVFLGKPDKKTISEELANLRGAPVLTVGEGEQFVNGNGMIGFCLEDNRIRFEVNLESAEKAKLRISAKLLALARRVVVGPRGG